ncbi:hypothetical protein HDU93_001465, partial [Gonapodya sp. JEL0774]
MSDPAMNTRSRVSAPQKAFYYYKTLNLPEPKEEIARPQAREYAVAKGPRGTKRT